MNRFRRTLVYRVLKSKIQYYISPNKHKIKNVFITGIAKGLGQQLAILFAKNGYQVIGLDIEKYETLDENVRNALIDFYEIDLSNLTLIEAMVDDVYKKHGHIDLLINNAGILNFKLLHEYDTEEIHKMVSVNLTSVMVLIKCILPRMDKNKFGRIINISSKSAFQAEDKFGIYSPTKIGLMLLSDSVAKIIDNEMWMYSITSNSINPDRINTPEFIAQNPDVNPKTLIDPEKVYRKIAYIVKSEVNGATISMFSVWKKFSFLLQFFNKLFL